MLGPDSGLRTQGELNFHDKVFTNEMNKQVQATKAAFDKMLFKEALRTGFFEMQKARDKYRELCAGELLSTSSISQVLRSITKMKSEPCQKQIPLTHPSL